MELFYYGCEFVYTAAVVWMIFKLSACIGKLKISMVWETVIQTVTMVVISGLKIYNTSLGTGVFSNGVILTFTVFTAIIVRIVYTNRLGDNLLIAGIFWMVVSLADFLIQTVAYQLFFQNLQVDWLLEISFGRGIYLLIWAGVITIVGVAYVHRIKRYLVAVFKHRRWLWGMCAVLLGCMVYFQRIYVYKKHEVSDVMLSHWWIFGLGLALISVVAAAYWMKRNEQKKSQLLQMKVEMLEDSYGQILKERENRDILVHDVKNHLRAISSLANQDRVSEINQYIQQMNDVLESGKSHVMTSHLMMDLVLDSKIKLAKEKGIPIRVETDEMTGILLSEMEICALFANLLDNAIEENERLGLRENGWVTVTCKRKNRLLMVKVVNPTDKELTDQMGLPETSKSDKALHGFGMRSIQQVAEKYGGYMNYRAENGEFEITVCISAFD